MGTIIAMAASGLARVKWWRAREVSDTRTQHLRSTFPLRTESGGHEPHERGRVTGRTQSSGDQCGKVRCCFQNAAKFKTRYSTFGFSDEANLDKGALRPVAYALKELTATRRGEDRCAREEGRELGGGRSRPNPVL